MTEKEYLQFCKQQLSGPFTDEDIITMLTAWGAINYSLGHKNALKENGIDGRDLNDE
ncbi:MAG TPA: hypothetical protein VKB19_18885 [Pedobacter sp.]|nr:hypothetical protein [Pedobacter sp.]